MSKNPLATGADTAGKPVTGGAKYQDLGYVGTGFEHELSGPSGKFTVINIAFDQKTDYAKLAQALSEGKMLAMRPRKVETRKVPNQAWAIVLREKVTA